MALFDLFKRRAAAPTDLRSTLIATVAREDWEGLAKLCEQHRDEIRAGFPDWKTVPAEVRRDPEAQGRYAKTLIAVAQLFAQAGDNRLIALLMGNQADNPIAVWQRALATAQTLLDQGQSQEAADLLQSSLLKSEGLSGDAVTHYLPRLHGMLGVALFRAGDAAGAIASTRRAKELCERAGDAEGVTTYAGNLHRMEGGTAVAFRDGAGKAVSLSDLEGTAGTYRYEVTGGDAVPPEAEELHERARQAGSQGDYPQAIHLLKEAAEKAPRWPYPLYDMAFSYLLMKDLDNAVEHYRRTLELSPRGFFTAMTALDTLEREQRGELPEGLYLAYMSLEQLQDRSRRASVARQIADKVPGFAPAWKEVAIAAEGDAERLTAIQKGLASNPDPETKGLLEINEALVLHARGEADVALRLLRALALDPASTLATEHLAKAALAMLERD